MKDFRLRKLTELKERERQRLSTLSKTDRHCDNVTPRAPDEAKNIFIEA